MEQENSMLIMFSHLVVRDGEWASEVGACYFFRGEIIIILQIKEFCIWTMEVEGLRYVFLKSEDL